MEKQREIDGLEQQQRSSAVDYNAFDGDEYHESNGNTAVITIIFGLFYCSSCFFLGKEAVWQGLSIGIYNLFHVVNFCFLFLIMQKY